MADIRGNLVQGLFWGISMRGLGLMLAPASMLLVACASSSSDVRPSYVSPLQYQHLSCQQISAEAERVSQRAAEVAGVQDSKSTNDAVATGVGVVLFWPALLFIKGDGQTAAELGRLRGEFEALEKVAIEKNCNLRFQQRAAKV